MQIKCKLIRHGGTRVDFGNVEYHFKANAQGDHVADVTDEDHIDALLAIGEAYEPYQDAAGDEAQGDLLDTTTAKPTRAKKTAAKPAATGDGDDKGDTE